MAGDPGITDQLDALVSGKRRAPRHPVRYRVRIQGVHRAFEALAQDLSEGGVMLELSEAELAGQQGDPLGAAQQLLLVEEHFRDSFDVHFPDCGVAAETTLVRLSVRPECPGLIYLGCQFVQALGDGQQRRLGLKHDHPAVQPWDLVEALQHLPLAWHPARPLFLLLFDASDAVAGPRYMGPARAAGAGALVVRIEGADASSVTRTLAGRTLHVQLMQGRHQVWCGPSRLLATRFVDGPSTTAEAGLLLEEALPRRVRRLFRP